MISGICIDDVALIQLARDGRTGMSSDALNRLQGRGYLTLTGSGAPVLSDAGRNRGESLAPVEADIKRDHELRAGGGNPLKAVPENASIKS